MDGKIVVNGAEITVTTIEDKDYKVTSIEG